MTVSDPITRLSSQAPRILAGTFSGAEPLANSDANQSVMVSIDRF
jgi:hypothetical protein